MMDRRIFFLAFISLSVCQAEIRCYVCTTLSGPYAEKCGDNFRLKSVDSVKCEGSCQKTRGIRSAGGRQVVEITRGCVPRTSVGCVDTTHFGVPADVCTCNEELCNSASRPVALSTETVIFSGLTIALSRLVVRIL